jgi:hypothetical protein
MPSSEVVGTFSNGMIFHKHGRYILEVHVFSNVVSEVFQL